MKNTVLHLATDSLSSFISKKSSLSQKYLTLNGIQTHTTLSCTGKQTAYVLLLVKKAHLVRSI